MSEKNENTTDWYDKHKFKIVLAAVKINNFNHKNKIGKLKFNDINDLINNIKSNTISEALAKQKLNALNEIKKAETRYKRLINGQKVLLNLFEDLVEAIFNNKVVNQDNNKIVNEDNNKIVTKDNNKILTKDNNVNDDDDDNDDDNDDDKDEITVKEINSNFEKIDETKSFINQIYMLKEIPWLNDYG